MSESYGAECAQCGATFNRAAYEMDGGGKHCPSCGAPMEWTDAAAEDPPPTMPETYDPSGRIGCSNVECGADAEVIPALLLRHKYKCQPTIVDIHVPVCFKHLPTLEGLVAGDGWRDLCLWVESQGRKRPRRKFSEVRFKRLRNMALAGEELLTPAEAKRGVVH